MNTVPLLLLAILGVVLVTGFIMMVFLISFNRRNLALNEWSRRTEAFLSAHTVPAPRPETWLAVRLQHPDAVQRALGMKKATPCSWSEALAGDHQWFIGPQIDGWIIITGTGIPNPDDDVDRCYHFLLSLSRKLGHVQFFHMDPLLQHHAWVRVEAGTVLRGYAWTGHTVWNQGRFTAAEAELGLKCFDYGDGGDSNESNFVDRMIANVDKVPLLASRWSLDPGRIGMDLAEKGKGLAGGSAPIA